jgi:hypothetical protein
MGYEWNRALADVFRAEAKTVWDGYQPDTRDGLVTPSAHLGDEPEFNAQALDELMALREAAREAAKQP